jgi:hypothetical protein
MTVGELQLFQSDDDEYKQLPDEHDVDDEAEPLFGRVVVCRRLRPQHPQG